MTKDHPIQFRAGVLAEPLAARAEAGQSRNAIAARDLERYYAILASELARLDLSEAAWSAIYDALNGSLLDAATARFVWAEIEDALPDGLAEKWGIDGPALVAELRALSLAGSLAVVDAAERYWAAVGRGSAWAPQLREQLEAYLSGAQSLPALQTWIVDHAPAMTATGSPSLIARLLDIALVLAEAGSGYPSPPEVQADLRDIARQLA